jgi:hypothetical protein
MRRLRARDCHVHEAGKLEIARETALPRNKGAVFAAPDPLSYI